MKICRFLAASGAPRVGLLTTDETSIIDLSAGGVPGLPAILEDANPVATLRKWQASDLPRLPVGDARLLAPVDRQEVWAAGVTYLRSKAARMEESEFSATAYDRVYEAVRPEIFFKSMPEKVVPTAEAVGIRRDATWSVPEPELALVLNSHGAVVGFTAGNDMSSRDIEGENLLYLPQAKIYDRSCALGPWITLGASETEARTWTIGIEIRRSEATVFSGSTTVAQIKRTFGELAEHLFRCQRFPHGAVLLTGTGVVPPETFTLQAGDDIEINLSGVGTLRNHVVVV